MDPVVLDLPLLSVHLETIVAEYKSLIPDVFGQLVVLLEEEESVC